MEEYKGLSLLTLSYKKYIKNIMAVELIILFTMLLKTINQGILEELICNNLVITIVFCVIFVTVSLGMIMLAIITVASIFYYFIYRKYKYISIKLEQNRIVHKSLNKEKHIKYEDIRDIKVIGLKYVFGLIIIKDGKTKIKIPINIQNVSMLVDKILIKLDNYKLNKVYNIEQLNAFKQTALISENSQIRMHEVKKSYFILSSFCFVIELFVVLLSNASVSQIILCPVCACLVSELLFIKLKNKITFKRSYIMISLVSIIITVFIKIILYYCK